MKTLHVDAHEREKEICPLCGPAPGARMCLWHILFYIYSDKSFTKGGNEECTVMEKELDLVVPGRMTV